MKRIRLLISIIIAIAVTVAIVLVQPSINQKEYTRSIEAKRAEIDRFMEYGADSPMPFNDLTDFDGLNYFAVDPTLRVRATVEEYPDPERIEVPTSAGTVDPYIRFGDLRFDIEGTEFALEAWKPVDGTVANRLFVVFSDLTAGDSTYAGGRYLNLFLDGDDTVTVDFNLAYNPYCVYDASYICPLVPPGNKLAVAIEAGEKRWK